MAEAKKLSIIVVSWNTRQLLRDCLRSVEPAATRLASELLVIDNASSDGSPEAVLGEFPDVCLLRNGANLGFAAANNQGISAARGEYVLLLNSDTLVPEGDIFAEWVRFMDEHPEVAASGCRLTWPDGRHQIGDAGHRPSLGTLLNHALFLSRLAPWRLRGLFAVGVGPGPPRAVDWVSGAALLARRSALDVVGLLDERFFMYAEDVEWCCRMRSLGYAVAYLPGLRIVHLQGGSAAPGQGVGLRWLESLQRLHASYHPREPRFLFRVVLAAGFLLRAALYAVPGVLLRDSRARDGVRRMLAYLRFLATSADPRI